MPEHINIAENMNLNFFLGNLNIHAIRLVKVLPDENWRAPEHHHADFEFHIIPQGKGYVQIEGTEFEVNAGEFYIVGPFVKHSQLSDKLNPMMEYCLECDITVAGEIPDKFSTAMLENQLLISLLSKCHPRSFKDHKGICLKFEEIIAEAQEKSLGYSLRIQTLILSLLIDIFRIVVSSSSINDVLKDKPSSNQINQQRINRLLNFIHSNYMHPIRIQDAASVLFLSERQINRLMKQDIQFTFHEYLANYRIVMATRLLKETNESIHAIAAETGFGSVRYMYQVFKKSVDATPNQLRKNIN